MKPSAVIAVYRPRAEKQAELRRLLAGHVAVLRREGLVTDSHPTYLESKHDGSVVEIFEWKSEDCARDAHSNVAVMQIWSQLGECAEFVGLASLHGSEAPFTHFNVLDLAP